MYWLICLLCKRQRNSILNNTHNRWKKARCRYLGNTLDVLLIYRESTENSLCGGYTDIPRDLRVIYEQKLVKMAFHQELVGKILSSSYVTCHKVVTYSGTLAITRGTRHRSAQVPRPYGTVQNGRETFPEWPTRDWLVCRSQAPHKLVVCHSGTRMSLGMDVSQSQVTLEIDQEWQLLPSHTGGT